MVESTLEHLRKIVRMMYSGTSSLDLILCKGKVAQEGIGYQRGSSRMKLASHKEIPHPKTVKVEEIIQMLPRMGTTYPNKQDKFET